MARKRKLTDEQEAELIAWWFSARSARAKARELGISPTVIYNTLCRHNVGSYREPKVRAYLRDAKVKR